MTTFEFTTLSVCLVVPIIPSRAWSQSQTDAFGSQSNESSQPSLLGLSMRMCEPETATDNVWHVLDVLEGSPAESAGLVPMGDWILGLHNFRKKAVIYRMSG
jgi:GRASP55/65 PDZ-like domain